MPDETPIVVTYDAESAIKALDQKINDVVEAYNEQYSKLRLQNEALSRRLEETEKGRQAIEADLAVLSDRGEIVSPDLTARECLALRSILFKYYFTEYSVTPDPVTVVIQEPSITDA